MKTEAKSTLPTNETKAMAVRTTIQKKHKENRDSKLVDVSRVRCNTERKYNQKTQRYKEQNKERRRTIFKDRERET